jgi:hypothetical protein
MPIPNLSTECSSLTIKLVIAGRPIYPFHYLGIWQWHTQEFFSGGKGSTNSVEDRGPPCQGFHSICKLMKPIFRLGCYGYIFHETGNSAQRWQNYRILGEVRNPPGMPLDLDRDINPLAPEFSFKF